MPTGGVAVGYRTSQRGCHPNAAILRDRCWVTIDERRSLVECLVGRGIRVARRARKQQNNDLIAWAVVVAILASFIINHEWVKALICLTAVFAVAIPVRCRVATGRGTPCTRTAYGLIFGCWKWHWLDKARARIGKHQKAIPRSPVSTRRRRDRGAEFEIDEAMPVRVVQTRTDRVMLGLGAAAACATLLTSFTPIARWFGAAVTWIASLFS